MLSLLIFVEPKYAYSVMAMEEYKSVERSDSQAEKTAASVIASRLSAEAEEEFVDERLENDNDSRITRVKFPSAARFASLPTSESINSSNSQASPRSTSHSNENDNKITAFDAIVHLSKGNLGPGESPVEISGQAAAGSWFSSSPPHITHCHYGRLSQPATCLWT